MLEGTSDDRSLCQSSELIPTLYPTELGNNRTEVLGNQTRKRGSYRWLGLPAAVLSLALLAACIPAVRPALATSSPTPTAGKESITTQILPSQPTIDEYRRTHTNVLNPSGNPGPSAQPGQCGPFEVPDWQTDGKLEYRCVDIDAGRGEWRLYLIGKSGQTITFENVYGDKHSVQIPYGQRVTIPNPVTGCDFTVINDRGPNDQPYLEMCKEQK